MPLRPTDRYTWERVLERAELPTAAKTVGLFMAMKGNQDGTRIRPGETRIAVACDWSVVHVAAQIRILREHGLLECVRPSAGPGRPALYRLTLPGEEMDPVPMRMDPDGVRITEKPKGRGGRRPKAETPVLPSAGERPNPSLGDSPEHPNCSLGVGPESPNSSSGESPNSSLDDEDRPDGIPKLELADTQTAVRQSHNSSSPNQTKPIMTNPVSGSYPTPTSAGLDSESDKTDRVIGPDPATAFRAARMLVDGATPAERESALGQARARLAHSGSLPSVKVQYILAAEIIGELRRMSQEAS